MHLRAALVLLAAAMPGPLAAQTVWNDSGFDASWSNSTNWSNGIPSTSTAVQIGAQPSLGLIGIDTGSIANTIGSLSFNNTLTDAFAIVPLGIETLTVTGAISNQSSITPSFQIQLEAGGNSTWSGPLSYESIVNIGTRSVTLAGAHVFAASSSITFDINSPSAYGRFIVSGSASLAGATLSIGGTYAGLAGDSFDLTTGNFSGATIGSLPALTSGLAWNTSAFLSDGVLSVSAIPEPSTWASLCGLATLGFVSTRRRRSV
jgi:hypothetical protein